jgi:transcription termination factor Rho
VSVLQRKDLEGSPLADLHAIASELSIEGYRGLRKAELIKAILAAQGGDAAEEESPAAEEEPPAAEEEPEADEGPEPEEEPEAEEEEADPVEEEPEVQEEPLTEEETATGVLDVLPNGSGFVRVDTDTAGQSRDDVYISPAQIRRCELRAGDAVSGPVRPPRRNERHPSLVRVETVNGAPAEPPEERPSFGDLTPVFPTERLTAPPALEGVPFGRGSRVAVGGPPGAGATTLLREVAATLADKHPEIELAVALAGVRPEEVTDWRRSVEVPVSGGSFDRSTDSQAQAIELAAERAKRIVERGGHAALVVDSLEALPPAVQRRVFGAARNTEEGGSLTVVAAIGMAWEPQRVATTRVMLDPPSPDSRAPQVSAARSATLRADLLGA